MTTLGLKPIPKEALAHLPVLTQILLEEALNDPDLIRECEEAEEFVNGCRQAKSETEANRPGGAQPPDAGARPTPQAN